jgi:DNA-binding winged helix-turn-helix (wHTH) protein
MSRIYRFEGIEIDVDRLVVIRQGVESTLRAQTFKVLVYLVENRQRVVTKDELTELWSIPGVSDQSLTQCIKEIRRAFGETGREQRYIRTVPKRGYQFVAEIERRDSFAAPERSPEPVVRVSEGNKMENESPVLIPITLAYSAMFVLALFVELSWQYDRFGALAWRFAPLVFVWISATTYGGLVADRRLTLAGRPNGLPLNIGIHVGAVLGLYLFLQPFLPQEVLVRANFQTFPVPAGYLKSILYFLFLILFFWLPSFHFVVAMQRELQEGRAQSVWDALLNTPGSLRPQGTIYPRFSGLLRLWVLVIVVGLAMTFHLFDNLKPGPHLNLFMSLVQVRVFLYLLLGSGCLLWYGRALALLKQECRKQLAPTARIAP